MAEWPWVVRRDWGGGAAAGAGSLVGQVVPGGAPPPTTVGEALAGQLHGGIEQLAEFLKGFSSAEILIALMMLAAMEKDDEDKSGGGAALGFLAGLAIASQFGQSSGFDIQSSISEPTFDSSGLGGNLNFTA